MSTPDSLGDIPEHAKQTIDDLKSKIAEYEKEIVKKKKGINTILESFDKLPIYGDLEFGTVAEAGPIHPGQFYGQPLATAVRAILSGRRTANKNAGPATITEIYDSLCMGGYLFDTSDPDNAKRGLRSTIGKNPIFHKLPTGHYGLTEWFPNIKPSKTKVTDEKNEAPEPAAASVAPPPNPEPTVPHGSLETPTAATNAQAEPPKPRKGKSPKVAPASDKVDDFDFEKKEAELVGAEK